MAANEQQKITRRGVFEKDRAALTARTKQLRAEQGEAWGAVWAALNDPRVPLARLRLLIDVWVRADDAYQRTTRRWANVPDRLGQIR